MSAAARKKQPSVQYRRDLLFYWLGNRLWFGLYMHANHHTQASLFNPMKYDQRQAEKAARREARAAAKSAAAD